MHSVFKWFLADDLDIFSIDYLIKIYIQKMDSKSMFSVNTFHASLHAADQHGSQTNHHQN